MHKCATKLLRKVQQAQTERKTCSRDSSDGLCELQAKLNAHPISARDFSAGETISVNVNNIAIITG